MGESLPKDETVREYLLGRVSDEATLTALEDRLFADEDFCTSVALAEDDLINDYVLGQLNSTDAESFETTLALDSERRFKVELTRAVREKALASRESLDADRPSFFASLAAFFQQPKYAGAFAVLVIAVVSVIVYVNRKDDTDQLAELRSIYQQGRPTETRISEFGYAPLPQLRGAPDAVDKNRLRRIENNLIEATEKNPSAKTHHALGVFRLTQREYPDAIREFESAIKFGEPSARLENDLGAAHFEFAKTVAKEKRLEELAQSLEHFTKATQLDSNFLEALFNKSLALEELAPRQAKESWNLYLQKDPSSPWAEEARKRLSAIPDETSLFKTDDEVLTDFLAAYRSQDNARAQKIHNETKGLLKESAVPLQLSRRLLIARQRGSDAEAKESLDALNFIGGFEQEQNADFFFSELADFYANASPSLTEPLLQAKENFATGQRLVGINNLAQAISAFEKSRDQFQKLGDECEAGVAENWAVQLLPDMARVSESRVRFASVIKNTEIKKFQILAIPAYYGLGMSDSHQNEISQSNKNLKTALRLAEAGHNAFEIQHAQEALALGYSSLGELEPALFYASKMLADEQLYYQNRNQYWRNKGTLADITRRLKFFATSLNLSHERLRIARESFPESNRVNETLRRLIDTATAQRDFPAALNYVHESMQIAQSRGESPENTRTTAKIYLLLADLRRETNECDSALTEYDKALDLFNRFPEVTDNQYQIHKGKLFCFQELDRLKDFSAELRTVLKLSEEYRQTIREDESRQAFFASEQDVFEAAAAKAIREHDNRQAFAYLEVSKSRSLLDFVESSRSIVEVEKALGPVTQPLSPAEIQGRLPDQVQLVQYAVLPDKLAIWVVTKTRFDLIEKQISAAELEKKIDAYQALIIGNGPAAEIKASGQELYQLLIPTDLAAEKQLCLVADKSLYQLAFATLVSPAGKFLLEDHALFYSPSASVLVIATENARRKEQVKNESLLSVGNPDFDREENSNLPDLKAAETEARTITTDYPVSNALLGSKATKESFLQAAARAEVIHFAGHFIANRQSPGNSKLLFAGGELRSSELGAYKLPRAKLEVMSACETGFERYDKSEGAIGIARTLLALGPPVVIATQWKVDSESTKDLMIAFHRNRKENRMSSAESLRRAQLEMLSAEKTKAPVYWAAFSQFGGYADY